MNTGAIMATLVNPFNNWCVCPLSVRFSQVFCGQTLTLTPSAT